MSVKLSSLAAAAAAVLGLAASSQAALLTYDVRVATTGNSAGVVRLGPKAATVSGVGDVVTLELFGILDDGNLDGVTTNDGISAAGGSFRSGVGGMLGNMGNGDVEDVFRGTGFSNGTPQNLDADTDVDLGSTASDPAQINAGNAFFSARTTNGSSPVQGTSLLLGTATFTVTSLDLAGTTINFFPAVLSTGVPAQRNSHIFTIDGTAFTRTGAGATAADVGSGPNVVISAIPEPATLGLATVAGLGLLARRRRIV